MKKLLMILLCLLCLMGCSRKDCKWHLDRGIISTSRPYRCDYCPRFLTDKEYEESLIYVEKIVFGKNEEDKVYSTPKNK